MYGIVDPRCRGRKFLGVAMATNRESGGMTPQMMRASGIDPMETNGYLEGEEEDVMEQKLVEIQEQSLGPLKEDLAEWLSRHLGIGVNADNFMDILDNGVYLCQMAKIIQRRAEECVQEGSYTEPLPNYRLRCKGNAPSGSWFARDNTANFLSWCKAFGMADDQMFETEYLVSHTAEKSVVLCLLELARLGYKFGLDPPSLIKMEREMDRMEEEPPPPRPPPPKPNSLDDEVKRIAFMCKCHNHVKKLGEGKYLIFGKVVQIRFLKNRHLMVRVGGGWDTLEHYLIHHNPVQVFEHQRPNTAKNSQDATNKYLVFKSTYKSE